MSACLEEGLAINAASSFAGHDQIIYEAQLAYLRMSVQAQY
jgi:hypothetical protein